MYLEFHIIIIFYLNSVKMQIKDKTNYQIHSLQLGLSTTLAFPCSKNTAHWPHGHKHFTRFSMVEMAHHLGLGSDLFNFLYLSFL